MENTCRVGWVWAPVARLLDEARPDELELSGEEVEDLLGPVADELAGAGIEVRWPAGVLQARKFPLLF